MVQRLGVKKEKKISAILGEPVTSAWTRGGWDHFWAEVQTATHYGISVNYRTGEVDRSDQKERKEGVCV